MLKRAKMLSFFASWEQRKLGECVLIQRGGSPRPIENYLTKKENGANWIKIGDVSTDSSTLPRQKKKYTILSILWRMDKNI